MKRNMITAFCALFALCGCVRAMEVPETMQNTVSDETEETNAVQPEQSVPVELQSDVWNDDNVMKALMAVSLAYDNYHPDKLAEYSTSVALIKVCSIDGTSSYFEPRDMHGSIYTYGRFETIEVYKDGELEPGQEYTFTRFGGIGTWEDYAAGRDESSLEKQLNAMKEAGKAIPEYVYEDTIDDIFIESGKTYLAFFEPSDMSAIIGAYPICGLQGGLREVDLERRLVLNNFTGEWENLDEVLAIIA